MTPASTALALPSAFDPHSVFASDEFVSGTLSQNQIQKSSGLIIVDIPIELMFRRVWVYMEMSSSPASSDFYIDAEVSFSRGTAVQNRFPVGAGQNGANLAYFSKSVLGPGNPQNGTSSNVLQVTFGSKWSGGTDTVTLTPFYFATKSSKAALNLLAARCAGTNVFTNIRGFLAIQSSNHPF